MPKAEHLLMLRFPSQAAQLQQVRDAVRKVATEQGCCNETADKMVMGVNEACMNIIQHAYGENNTGEIVLDILNNEQTLVFRLTDFADPVDKQKIKSRQLDDIRPGGLGVHFIQDVMDEVSFVEPPQGAGNVLEMKKRIV